jgi:hypothetical protein
MNAPDWSVRSFPAGVVAHVMEPGDFILAHRRGFCAWVVRVGQRIRFRGERRRFACWDHAALVVSAEGDLVEALLRTGATRSHISKYAGTEYTLIRTHASPADQLEILRYADREVGAPYGLLQDLFVFLGYLFAGYFAIGIQHQINCSGLVACAQTRMGAYFDRLPETMTPADLACYYDATLEGA